MPHESYQKRNRSQRHGWMSYPWWNCFMQIFCVARSSCSKWRICRRDNGCNQIGAIQTVNQTVFSVSRILLTHYFFFLYQTTAKVQRLEFSNDQCIWSKRLNYSLSSKRGNEASDNYHWHVSVWLWCTILVIFICFIKKTTTKNKDQTFNSSTFSEMALPMSLEPGILEIQQSIKSTVTVEFWRVKYH